MRVSLVNKVEDAHEDALWCVAWQPDSRSLITGSVDETVKVWTLGEPGSTTVESAHTYTGHTLGVISVAIDATGKFAASSALDSFIRVWNLEVTRVPSEERGCAECGAPPHAGRRMGCQCSRRGAPGQHHQVRYRHAALRDVADCLQPDRRPPDHRGRGRQQQPRGRVELRRCRRQGAARAARGARWARLRPAASKALLRSSRPGMACAPGH